MSDIKIDLGVAEVIEKVADTEIGAQVDKTGALLIRSIRAALSPLEKWVLQREFNLEETKKLLELKLQNVAPENIITPPSYIGVPALQAISYCVDDEQLRNMYAELLANAMNSEKVDTVHPTFVEIIKQLSPFDALVFKELIKTLVQPCISIKYKNIRNQSSYPVHDIIAFKNTKDFPLVKTQISLENLERLRLIEINRTSKYNDEEKYDELKESVSEIVKEFIRDNNENFEQNDYQIIYGEFVILIRGFGQMFARACLGENFENIV